MYGENSVCLKSDGNNTRSKSRPTYIYDISLNFSWAEKLLSGYRPEQAHGDPVG
jgi:hypothetical protein